MKHYVAEAEPSLTQIEVVVGSYLLYFTVSPVLLVIDAIRKFGFSATGEMEIAHRNNTSALLTS